MNLERYISIPFRPQGRDLDGCDCWGLLCLVYREVLGIELTAFADTPTSALRDVARHAERYKAEFGLVAENRGDGLVARETPRPFDIVMMRAISRETSRLVAHFGLVVDGRRVLHVNEGKGSRAERMDRPHIAGCIMEIRRHPLVA